MAATLAVAGLNRAGGTAARSAESTAGSGKDGETFAEALQAQAPAGQSEPSPAPQPDRDAGAAPVPAQYGAAGPTENPQGADATDRGEAAPLDPAQVQTVLGLCDASGGAGADAIAVGTADAQSVADPASVPPCMPTTILAALPAPQPAAFDPGASQPPDGIEPADAGLLAAAALDSAAGAALRVKEEALAGQLEAMLGNAPEVASSRDTTPEGPASFGTDPRAAAVARTPDAPAAPARPGELRTPLGTPAWTDELGSRVTWMVEKGEQVASLRLSPENLGPLEVRIAVREGETTVWFGAVHPETRAALEQSLPRLREMLGASGLALANAGVFSQTPRDPQRGFTAAALARAAVEGGADAVAGVNTVTHRGLVDLYA